MARYPRRHQYDSYEEYAQAFHEFGGPQRGQTYYFPTGMGYYCDLMNAIHGETPEIRAQADAYEEQLKQQRQAGTFVKKYRG